MTIEEEIFKKAHVDFAKVTKYGFIKDKSVYKYSKNIMNDTFRVDVEINAEGIVKGYVYDLSFNDEYTNFRMVDNIGPFASQVLFEFENVLNDIKDNCFNLKTFIYDQTNRIAKKIQEKYQDKPEFEWEKFPGFANFKNRESKKWYALIMNLDKSKIESNSKGEIEILNLKLAPNKIEELLKQKGYYPAYHMNKKSWITIILDDTVSDETIMNLVDESYSYTVVKKNIIKNEWIIPANPKYYSVKDALKESNIILWKQSTDIKVDDIVYLYLASPYSSIMYKFKVLEVNIPYQYKDNNLNMKKAMKIELLKEYPKGELSFDKLKEFGVNSIRGPRYMPVELSEYIKKKL